MADKPFKERDWARRPLFGARRRRRGRWWLLALLLAAGLLLLRYPEPLRNLLSNLS